MVSQKRIEELRKPSKPYKLSDKTVWKLFGRSAKDEASE